MRMICHRSALREPFPYCEPQADRIRIRTAYLSLIQDFKIESAAPLPMRSLLTTSWDLLLLVLVLVVDCGDCLL